MFGWFNDCIECLIVTKFGTETWHRIKAKADCIIADRGFLRYKHYADSDTVELIVAASDVLGISVDDVLFSFGEYFIDYVEDNGYSNVLQCLGSNLRDWLSNLNTLHDHLQASYPKGFIAPVFWSEDDPDSPKEESAILVYYYSKRGSLLAPMVVGVIRKLARVYFDIEIVMEQLTLQDEENDVPHTSWKVTTKTIEESGKLRGHRQQRQLRKPDHSSDQQQQQQQDVITLGSTTTVTTMSRYQRIWEEGGTQASNLRVEEFVKRSFFHPECELYHALTMEHYTFLENFWKVNKLKSSFCYEKWTMEEGNPSSWATLKDLPAMLNPKTYDSPYFGGKMPMKGAYPPDDMDALQSFPPKVRVLNPFTGDRFELVLTKQTNIMMKEAIYDQMSDSWKTMSNRGEKNIELQCSIWDEEKNEAFHTFAIDDLQTTSTKQLYDMVPIRFDPVILVLGIKEAADILEDEEDI